MVPAKPAAALDHDNRERMRAMLRNLILGHPSIPVLALEAQTFYWTVGRFLPGTCLIRVIEAQVGNGGSRQIGPFAQSQARPVHER